MNHSITLWNLAKRPNYTTNVDRTYPYSEVPYIGQYHLVKIPLSETLIDHVDYWGEGRITSPEGISGFSDCYNINHQYQLVSNGSDTDYKIPNRIPVINYTNCTTNSYIKDNSVKLVTLMGAPINKSCAKDIGRIINSEAGKVVVFGFRGTEADIKNLEEELTKKNILHSPGYDLPDTLMGLTLFDNNRAYLNQTELADVLYKNVADSAYDNAVDITKVLDRIKKGNVISEVVAKLLKDGKKNVLTYAYKLWNSADDIVRNNFPAVFRYILNEDEMKIVSKKDALALKLDANVDTENERFGFGDSNDKTVSSKWKFVPFWEENNLYFKIMDVEYTIYLKLEQVNGEGEMKGKGATATADSKYLWSLEPLKVNDEILFSIINRQYNQGLTLDENANSNGEKQLLGRNGSVYEKPEQFGWFLIHYEDSYEYLTKPKATDD